MATEFKCDYCTAAVENNATLVHTQRNRGQWDLDCSMCPDCFKHFKVVLEKAKSQKSWTGWTALEQEVASLRKEDELHKSELQFLRQHDPFCDQLMTADPRNELLMVKSEGGEEMVVHRSILMSRSAVIKEILTSEDAKKHQRRHANKPIELWCVPRHADSFHAFIEFLYTAELKPEILKDHAPELMEAGNKNAIELLTRKCEDYIVNDISPENAINYLTVGEQCNSEAIRAAAIKQIKSNPKEFVNREEFKALKNSPVCFAALREILLDSISQNSIGSDPGSLSGSEPGLVSDSVPGLDSMNSGLPWDRNGASHVFLGKCTCSVHPIPHSAAPGYGYPGWPFQATTAMPSTAHYVDPASALEKLQLEQ